MKQDINEHREIPKHKKKTKSNVSKSKFKAKHKHQYEECLLQYDYHVLYSNKIIKYTSLRSYCTICGKIGDRCKEDNPIVKDYRRVIDTPIGKSCSVISDEELYEKYHNKLPVFYLEDGFNKYVTIDEMDGE